MSTSNNSLISVIVGVALVVIMATVFMMPIISDATTTEDTFTNDHSYYVVKNPETATITWDGSKMEIDGETVNVPDATENPYGVSILSKINGVIRYNADNTVQKWGDMGAYNATLISAMNLSIASDTLTGTFTYGTGDDATNVNVNLALGDTYYILSNSNESEDVLTVSDGNLYVNGDTVVQSNGVSKTDNNIVNGVVVFNVSGSIDDGFTITGYNRNGGAELTNITYSNLNVDYTTVSDHLDLYKINKVTFTTTVTDTDNNDIVVNHSYDYFAAPLEITAERAVHLDDSEIALVEIIPILVIAGLIVGVVGYVVRARLS